jgi:membrane protein DedA with SNARE-associated domain
MSLGPAVHAYLHQYGYVAVFAGILGEDFGLPLPGETLLIAGAMATSSGSLSIWPLMAWAWAGAVIGDNIGYLIGALGGRTLVLRFGRYVFLTHERLSSVEHFFARHGGKVVLFARFFEGLRQLNGIAAGIGRMPWKSFLVYNAIGAALWVGVWGLSGHLLGAHLHDVMVAFDRLQRTVWVSASVAGAAVVLGYVLWKLLRRRRDRT